MKLFEPVDMTEGNPVRQIIKFTIPMLLGNVAQQLYNTVDSIIVGRFVGDNALAAVGSAGPILNLLLVLFMGVAVGASIMISQYFGARQREDLSKAVGSCFVATGVASLFIMITGPLISGPLLRLLGTPESIIGWCEQYLFIICVGIAGGGYYNINPDHVYTNGSYAVTAGTNTARKDLNMQAYLNYARVFAEDHDVSAMLLFNRESTTNENSGQKVPEKFMGMTLKVGYKYQNRYLLDFNAAYNGSDRFAAGHRYGWFPAVGVGWVVSEEPWFKKIFEKSVDHLKIRSSFGLVGSDVAMGNRYLYNQVYEVGSSYYFGDRAINWPGYREGALGNDHVTWEKARKFDIGIDLNLWRTVSITIDYFYDHRYDQLVYRGDIPLIIGVGTSPVNVAKTMNQGIDGQIGYRNTWGDWGFNTNFVFSYAKNRILFQQEAQQRVPWLMRTGHPI